MGGPSGPLRMASQPRMRVEVGVVEHVAVAQVAVGAEVEVDLVELDAGGAHDLQGLGDDRRADAVAGDDADPMWPCRRLVSS